jgi:hypothetical protein
MFSCNIHRGCNHFVRCFVQLECCLGVWVLGNVHDSDRHGYWLLVPYFVFGRDGQCPAFQWCLNIAFLLIVSPFLTFQLCLLFVVFCRRNVWVHSLDLWRVCRLPGRNHRSVAEHPVCHDDCPALGFDDHHPDRLFCQFGTDVLVSTVCVDVFDMRSGKSLFLGGRACSGGVVSAVLVGLYCWMSSGEVRLFLFDCSWTFQYI